MRPQQDGDLEWELEDEFEGDATVGLEGEFEDEYEGGPGLAGLPSMEYELEDEFEGEYEDELEFEDEYEFEGEGEPFFKGFKRIARGIGGFVRRSAPALRSIARVAVPMVAGAVGGPVGGILGRVATQALGEGEFEDEFEDEGEFEFEDEAAPITAPQALAEALAAVAARARTDTEAEAMIGAAAVGALSAADRAALRRVLPNLVRGVAVLTRILRRRRAGRPVVRAVPAIMRRTATVLRRRASAGQPVTRRTAARAMASQTRKVLSRPATCAAALRRNVQAARVAARPIRRP
jgi:hypothetical protein